MIAAMGGTAIDPDKFSIAQQPAEQRDDFESLKMLLGGMRRPVTAPPPVAVSELDDLASLKQLLPDPTSTGARKL